MQSKIIKIILCPKSVVFLESSYHYSVVTTIHHIFISPMGIMNVILSIIDRVVDGKAPAKVIAKVNEWIDINESELLSAWEKAQNGEKIEKITPLK